MSQSMDRSQNKAIKLHDTHVNSGFGRVSNQKSGLMERKEEMHGVGW